MVKVSLHIDFITISQTCQSWSFFFFFFEICQSWSCFHCQLPFSLQISQFSRMQLFFLTLSLYSSAFFAAILPRFDSPTRFFNCKLLFPLNVVIVINSLPLISFTVLICIAFLIHYTIGIMFVF